MRHGRFEYEDLVVVVMTRNDCFPWQKGPSFSATFHDGPQGAGDTFTLKVGARLLYLNGNSEAFVGAGPDGSLARRGR